jgi:iron complex transport system substrate-binding protein
MTDLLARHRSARLLLVTLGIALLATACGDDDTDASADTDTTVSDTSAAADTSATDAAADGPVTIEHAFGTTTLDERPERIVALGVQWTDVLLAMGVQPVGVLLDPLAGPDGTYPWQTDLDPDVTGIDGGDVLPLEQIAALDPDLIVVTYAAPDQATYDDLAAVAPTIPLLGGRDVDAWQDLTTVAGQLLREPERAEEVIAGVEQLVADTAAAMPGLVGRTFALANYIPGDSIWVVADPDDGSSVFFQQLGMDLEPGILAAADGAVGRVQLSLEQADLLAADLLVVFSNDGDPRDLVGYEQLPAVVSGATSELDYAAVVGLNTPSPLSIPYSLELVRPALEALGAES